MFRTILVPHQDFEYIASDADYAIQAKHLVRATIAKTYTTVTCGVNKKFTARQEVKYKNKNY